MIELPELTTLTIFSGAFQSTEHMTLFSMNDKNMWKIDLPKLTMISIGRNVQYHGNSLTLLSNTP